MIRGFNWSNVYTIVRPIKYDKTYWDVEEFPYARDKQGRTARGFPAKLDCSLPDPLSCPRCLLAVLCSSLVATRRFRLLRVTSNTNLFSARLTIGLVAERLREQTLYLRQGWFGAASIDGCVAEILTRGSPRTDGPEESMPVSAISLTPKKRSL
jgi:hypothetical protein